MDETRLIEYTARDAVRLFAKLYLVKVAIDIVAGAASPAFNEWADKKKAERDLRRAQAETSHD